MSDQRIETRVKTPQGEISFQEFFVKQRWAPTVSAVRFEGAEKSQAGAGRARRDSPRRQRFSFVRAIRLPVSGRFFLFREFASALTECTAPVIAVSPIIGATAISGPAHKLMIACGFEASALGVARCYADFLDTILIADEDSELREPIEGLGVTVITANIRMPGLADKRRLARQLLALAAKIV